ncbi:mannitol dehydrogenase family protein [Labrenzia sp. PHM005]|uniref:mannitol dehydrogenase family protein n=1 Tax=Labrenzia sp. PHM005 TaxID=2590016 RepID=UPI0011407051|nr:mannitol dehydrogenase family protein [Labrenzia sp. PHM005]QDG74909.1 mannitol dehydrogenase family protein [Labrenzia sp. PHM005]
MTANISRPPYNRASLKVRLFHIGFGAFAKAHTSVFHDEMLRQTGSDWGMAVARLNSGESGLTALDEAGHLFAVGEMSDGDLDLRQVGAVIKTLHPNRDGIEALIAQIADPDLQVITLTITEKGYCLAREVLDLENPDIAADLENPSAPKSAIGLLVEGLYRRKEAGLPGLTVLSCDNLPSNGKLCRTAVLEFAGHRDPDLKTWIADTCRFPCSMVDRITPAMTEDSFNKLEVTLGAPDPNGILCEPFRQWVIEDNFAGAKPHWDLAGASFVDDVEPFEDIKLRMLNGSHSFLAYLGALAGKETIADCMADPVFKSAAHKLMMSEQAPSLTIPAGFDIEDYAGMLIDRYSNRALHHKTTQIAADGSQKLPQRILAPVRSHLDAGRPWPLAALAIAGWMHYCRGVSEAGTKLPVNDPHADRVAELASGSDDDGYVLNMMLLAGIFGSDLPANPSFVGLVTGAYETLKTDGVNKALAACL